jgi:hypothetical protein
MDLFSWHSKVTKVKMGLAQIELQQVFVLADRIFLRCPENLMY